MKSHRVGFVGWRGMVGSVLMERMRAEGDFAGLEPEFFSTSQGGDPAPDVGVDGTLAERRQTSSSTTTTSRPR